ncbi:PAS domain S-box protein [Scytonema sp. UIC 10036]|uniref:PAS domain-containing sensor histidine kinase n=1 Tax=Scytonema sp. UIC 10036 TaxID=2304196 RepID=UPI0012DAD172|nr:PAS domain-containing sensor histidine kinase [Scytonema sp. UIC 10036]MUH01244.1 PAS domain S-box protein [Scytonema sp. UIC 10036]
MVVHNFVLEQGQPGCILQPEEELQFAKLFLDRTGIAIFWVDPQARFLYVNHSACVTTGYSHEEFFSMTVDKLNPLFCGEAWSSYWRKIKQQRFFTFESLHYTKEGWAFPVEIAVTYLKYYDRECACLMVSNITKEQQIKTASEYHSSHSKKTILFEKKTETLLSTVEETEVLSNNLEDLTNSGNITVEALEFKVQECSAKLNNFNELLSYKISDRKQVESALQESEERFRATFNQAAVGLAHVGTDGHFVLVNQKFCDILGYTSEDLLERSCPAITHPEDLKTELEYVRQILANEIQTYSMDKRYICKNSAYVWIHTTVSLVRDSYGSAKYFLVVTEDITERKRIEEALCQSEARFRTLAEMTNVIIFIQQGTQFCYVNPAAEYITGYKREELLAHTDIWELIKERRQLHRQQQSDLVQSQEIKHCEEEMKILTKNGEERWLNCSIGTIEFEGKLAVLGTAIDITKHKQAEVDIRQALEQEKELSELRARFISIVSHEFRTPLNNISFSTSSLRRYGHKWTEEEKLEYLYGIETDVEQLNSLLDQALFIGGAEAGKRKFEPQPLDVVQLCRHLLAEMQMQNSGEHVFSFVSQSECLTACVDKKLLQPILTNLLSNAMKYSPSNSQIDLQLSCQNENLIFQISDKGIGIPLADRQQLFEPFHRASNVGEIEGTGLGLSIVKKFVDLHGGEIRVDSTVGVGTTFIVTLPLINQPKTQ